MKMQKIYVLDEESKLQGAFSDEATPKASKVLEINPNHELFKAIKTLESNDESKDLYKNPEIKDFYKFDNSRELKDIKIKKYKHMGPLKFDRAQ
mgnify:CR=1 FL=1